MSEESRSDPSPLTAWETLSKKTIASCRIFDVTAKRCRHPKNDSEAEFYIIETTDWANVLAITPDYQVVIVNQYRFGIEKTSWELPGGVIDSGEDPVKAALRELEEETGYVARSSRLIGDLNPNPAIMDNHCYLVLAEGVECHREQNWDEHEEIEIKTVPLDEVYRMAHAGEITHSLMLNTLFMYYPEWERHKRRRRDQS